jgi:lipopolysaccharide biosynthesis glycosyltransferase
MGTKAMCTIVAKNYIAQARTLCNSFSSFHPDCKIYVLIVDDFRGYLTPSAEPFEIVSLNDLRIPNLRSFCFKYDITELCTAAKPFLLEHLARDRAIAKLLYLDPDILVTNRLDRLYSILDRFDIVLTPHIDTDFPEDGLQPDDSAMFRTGIFNLGFIGVRNSDETRLFLDWWKSKLYNKCAVDYQRGYFVDQKFMDLGSVIFENVHIERGVGYNVAYWNLHSRRIEKKDGKWSCNGGPLYFFHFSGYQQSDPERLTYHVPKDVARHRISDNPEIKKLFLEYRERVDENDYAAVHRWPYTFATFSNGAPIPYQYRRLYRDDLREMEAYGDPFESPAAARRLFLKRLANDDTVLARVLSTAYMSWPHLQLIFKRLFGPRLTSASERTRR